MKIKLKLFPKSLRVYTVENEVAEGFEMRLTKGAGVVYRVKDLVLKGSNIWFKANSMWSNICFL